MAGTPGGYATPPADPARWRDATPIPESTKTSLGQRLRQRQRERWPGLAGVDVRFRGRFAYVDGELEGEDSVLPSGLPVGTPEEALDCACGLYLNDPSAWQEHLPPAGS